MKRKLLIALAALLLLGGIGVLLYPSFKTALFRQAEKGTIRQFEQYRSTAPVTTVEPPVPDDPENSEEAPPAVEERPFPELWEACVSYNELLVQTQQERFSSDAWKKASIVLSDYGWEQEIFGYLSIPSANIEAPLYLGGSMTNLNKGAAILGQTSMPIGGASTNCVIAGHRTWNGIMHPFVGLEKVEVGDLLYLTNPWETLTYRVVGKEIIYPDNSDKVRIQEGRDLISIFTCTYPNTRRVLVTCERIIEEG